MDIPVRQVVTLRDHRGYGSTRTQDTRRTPAPRAANARDARANISGRSGALACPEPALGSAVASDPALPALRELKPAAFRMPSRVTIDRLVRTKVALRSTTRSMVLLLMTRLFTMVVVFRV